MLYDIEKTIRFLDDKGGIKAPKDLYDALNFGGLSFVDFRETSHSLRLKWDKDSSIDDFYVFWKNVVGEQKISQSPNVKITTGDIIAKKNKKTKRYTELIYVLKSEEKLYKVCGQSIVEKVSIEDLLTDSESEFWHLYMSRIDSALSIYYNLIFKQGLVTNKMLFAKLIIACCPDKKNSNGTERSNSGKNYLFESIDMLELQNEIENSILTARSEPTPVQRKFIKSIFIREGDRKKSDEKIDAIYKGLQRGEICTERFLDAPTVSRLFNGEVRGLENFFNDKTNRKMFQERFSLVLQFYFLLSRHVKAGRVNKNPIPSVNDGCYSSEIKEYITLMPEEFERATQIIQYYTSNSDIMIDSLFGLSGYIFDAMAKTAESSSPSKDAEYARFQELVDCYGTGTLDYYLALERYKDINHYAAEALSSVYHFGRTFEGFEVKKDIEKSIAILNTCKDQSVTARWSLAENHKMLSVNFSNEDMHDSNDEHWKMARFYFESCGNYHPALNSLSNFYRRELRFSDESKKPEIATKAIQYATKAASSGWVYAFNNLYVLLNDDTVSSLLSDTKGKRVIRDAYQVLVSGKVTDNMSKMEIEFNQIKWSLERGKEKNLVSYLGKEESFVFKYFEPVERPENFLVVSAYLGNLYGMNYLGLYYCSTGENEKGKALFESAAIYGHWGYYNLAHRIYNDDSMKCDELLSIAAKKGNDKAKRELHEQQESSFMDSN